MATIGAFNQIEGAYGQNNAILDNCHVRVSFSTNDERTARRVSDSLGTATEMRAMKNYAGNRLSPWLSHLMVSRQETARPLLTPGEVMQLPPDDALIQVSGAPPIRAKKARYYSDRRLADRVVAAPATGAPIRGGGSGAGEWTQVLRPPPAHVARGLAEVDEGGQRIEPELLGMEPSGPAREIVEFEAASDEGGDELQQADQLQGKFKFVARQAALDPNDGIPL